MWSASQQQQGLILNLLRGVYVVALYETNCRLNQLTSMSPQCYSDDILAPWGAYQVASGMAVKYCCRPPFGGSA